MFLYRHIDGVLDHLCILNQFCKKKKKNFENKSMAQSVKDLLLKRFSFDSFDNDDDNEKCSLDLNLKFERVLRIDSKRKQVCLQCIYDQQPAILILEKNPFDEQLLAKIGNNFRYVHILFS